jgi:hypothetical protein
MMDALYTVGRGGGVGIGIGTGLSLGQRIQPLMQSRAEALAA